MAPDVAYLPLLCVPPLARFRCEYVSENVQCARNLPAMLEMPLFP